MVGDLWKIERFGGGEGVGDEEGLTWMEVYAGACGCAGG
ncbi:hypothetical protein T12_12592, partial [Trichinella patagoniensis]